MKFGDVLRELLEEQNLSQKQLAAELNISASALGNYIRNNREPDFEILKRIARYFCVSTDFLLNYQLNSRSDYRDQKLLQQMSKRTYSLNRGNCLSGAIPEKRKNHPIWDSIARLCKPYEKLIRFM